LKEDKVKKGPRIELAAKKNGITFNVPRGFARIVPLSCEKLPMTGLWLFLDFFLPLYSSI